MKNRQIGLDGRVFISDCLTDGIFFVYSIIICGVLSAVGDIMKLLGTSGRGMDELTNGVILCDLICSLGMIVVSYYVYFMNCGENVPKLGTKPLIILEYLRLAYYGMLAYFLIFNIVKAMHTGEITAAIPVYYLFYLAWLVACIFASSYILTLLHQNSIRRNYEELFKRLALIGMALNLLLPMVYIVTRFWVRGYGDGFYSAGLCDFIRLCIAPVFYCGVWFIYLNAIDRVHKVFDEVDSAIRDKRYQIEFDDNDNEVETAEAVENEEPKAKKKTKGKRKKKKGSDSEAVEKAAETTEPTEPEDSLSEEKTNE